MYRVATSVLLVVLLTGCATKPLVVSGGDPASYDRNHYGCVQESRTSYAAGGSGAMGGLMILAAASERT